MAGDTSAGAGSLLKCHAAGMAMDTPTGGPCEVGRDWPVCRTQPGGWGAGETGAGRAGSDDETGCSQEAAATSGSCDHLGQSSEAAGASGVLGRPGDQVGSHGPASSRSQRSIWPRLRRWGPMALEGLPRLLARAGPAGWPRACRCRARSGPRAGPGRTGRLVQAEHARLDVIGQCRVTVTAPGTRRRSKARRHDLGLRRYMPHTLSVPNTRCVPSRLSSLPSACARPESGRSAAHARCWRCRPRHCCRAGRDSHPAP